METTPKNTQTMCVFRATVTHSCQVTRTLLYMHDASVCLSLNDFPNQGNVVISDTDSTDDTALVCHTVKPVYSGHPIEGPPLYKGHLCEPR